MRDEWLNGDEIVMALVDCVGPTLIRQAWDKPSSVWAWWRAPALAVFLLSFWFGADVFIRHRYD